MILNLKKKYEKKLHAFYIYREAKWILVLWLTNVQFHRDSTSQCCNKVLTMLGMSGQFGVRKINDCHITSLSTKKQRVCNVSRTFHISGIPHLLTQYNRLTVYAHYQYLACTIKLLVALTFRWRFNCDYWLLAKDIRFQNCLVAYTQQI